jgi:hypothetical protein
METFATIKQQTTTNSNYYDDNSKNAINDNNNNRGEQQECQLQYNHYFSWCSHRKTTQDGRFGMRERGESKHSLALDEMSVVSNLFLLNQSLY